MQKNTLYVAHVEDEPWDYEHIVKELRSSVYEFLGEEFRSMVSLKRITKQKQNYPSGWILSWEYENIFFQIEYWFVTDEAQLKDKIKSFKNNSIFILDVMRVGDDGLMTSDWNLYATIIEKETKNYKDNVRLYTAYDIENNGEQLINSQHLSTNKEERPEVIYKGDLALFAFILNAVGLQ